MDVVCVLFFFKQKTAYEMLRSLVGSEMCIRDSLISRMKLMKMMIDSGPKNEEVWVSALASLVDRGSLLSAMASGWLN